MLVSQSPNRGKCRGALGSALNSKRIQCHTLYTPGPKHGVIIGGRHLLLGQHTKLPRSTASKWNERRRAYPRRMSYRACIVRHPMRPKYVFIASLMTPVFIATSSVRIWTEVWTYGCCSNKTTAKISAAHFPRRFIDKPTDQAPRKHEQRA